MRIQPTRPKKYKRHKSNPSLTTLIERARLVKSRAYARYWSDGHSRKNIGKALTSGMAYRNCKMCGITIPTYGGKLYCSSCYKKRSSEMVKKYYKNKSINKSCN